MMPAEMPRRGQVLDNNYNSSHRALPLRLCFTYIHHLFNYGNVPLRWKCLFFKSSIFPLSGDSQQWWRRREGFPAILQGSDQALRTARLDTFPWGCLTPFLRGQRRQRDWHQPGTHRGPVTYRKRASGPPHPRPAQPQPSGQLLRDCTANHSLRDLCPPSDIPFILPLFPSSSICCLDSNR